MPGSGPSASISQVRFVDDKLGFAVLVRGSVGSNGDVYVAGDTILRTTDGGASWTETGTTSYGGQPSPAPSSESVAGAMMSSDPIIPVDANTLWTFCSPPSLIQGQTTCPLLRVSHDSGGSWSTVSLPGLGDTASANLMVLGDGWSSPDGIQFISSTEGYLAVSEQVGGMSRIHYFRTTDGGRSWTQVSQTEQQSPGAAPTFIDATHWFQTGMAQSVIAISTGGAEGTAATNGFSATADGGKTWRILGTELGGVTNVWMSDDLHGAALTTSADMQWLLYLTSDGGETWRLAQLSMDGWQAPSSPGITVPPTTDSVWTPSETATSAPGTSAPASPADTGPASPAATSVPIPSAS
jgi:hypothetical protein